MPVERKPRFSTLLEKNEGQVKLNTGNSVKPSYVWGGGGGNPSPGTEQQITYASPLGFSSAPTTQWPENIENPVDGNFYDFTNDTFIENLISGQVNAWRCIFDYTGKPIGTTAAVVHLINQLSGFELFEPVSLPPESTEGSFSAVFYTIADAASLPAPLGTGQGYEIWLNSDDPITIEVDSITRLNYQKNPR